MKIKNLLFLMINHNYLNTTNETGDSSVIPTLLVCGVFASYNFLKNKSNLNSDLNSADSNSELLNPEE